MKTRMMRPLVGFALLTIVGTANATMWTFSDLLSALEQVPVNASPATGLASGTFDDVTNQISITVNATGFVANVTAAHIHQAPFGTNGTVIVPFSGATGSTSYSTSKVATLTAAQATAFLADGTYVNIHSTQFPGGEIRGQLRPTAVPEPATMLALGSGAVALLGRRRRKA